MAQIMANPFYEPAHINEMKNAEEMRKMILEGYNPPKSKTRKMTDKTINQMVKMLPADVLKMIWQIKRDEHLVKMSWQHVHNLCTDIGQLVETSNQLLPYITKELRQGLFSRRFSRYAHAAIQAELLKHLNAVYNNGELVKSTKNMRHDFRVLLRSTLLEAANHNYEAHHMLITHLDMDDGPMDPGLAELDPYRWI